MLQKARKFLEEIRQELRHINWPSRQETVKLTTVVIVSSLVLAAFLGAFDYLFSYFLRVFVLKSF